MRVGTSEVHPRRFEYTRAGSIAEALELLGDYDLEAKLIAGGQSLVPMMSLGLAAPDRLVDIDRLELAGLEERNGTVVVGGLTRHRELERGEHAARVLPLVAEAARFIGNPRVRNRGTIAGSLSHADPAAELGAAVLAHGGSVILEGPDGERRVAIEGFFFGYFETAVNARELLTRIELERAPAGSGSAFVEVASRADDFATAAAAAIVAPAPDGRSCAEARLALAGAADRPVRMPEAERLCVSGALDGTALAAVADAVAAHVTPEDDAFISAAYRRRAAATCAVRALEIAWRRAREQAG